MDMDPFARPATAFAFAVWALLLMAVGTAMMVDHWVGIPVTPPADARPLLRAAHAPATGWSVVHVLYASCPCSRRIVDHLVARRPFTDTTESVLLLGELPKQEEALQAAGYGVVHVDAVGLAALAIDAAPAFVVVKDGVVRHSGGYSAHKQGLDYADAATVAALRRGDLTVRLPVLGCAVSRELQRLLDPLLLKYRDLPPTEHS